jgi:hypothetical protein
LRRPKLSTRKFSAWKKKKTVFWDKQGGILEHYILRGNTVTSTTYADLLKNHLRPAIKSKRRGPLSTGVLLQHDNARFHTAHATVATIQVCPLRVFHIRRTHQTSPPVSFMSLDRSKRQWDAGLSGPGSAQPSKRNYIAVPSVISNSSISKAFPP